MALDTSVFQNLQQPKAPDILAPYRTLSELRTLQLQQADIASQVQERQAIAQQRQAQTQKGQNAAKWLMDFHTQNPDADMSDPATHQKIYQGLLGVDPTIAEGYLKTQGEYANTQSEIGHRKAEEQNAANVLAETQKKNAFEQAKDMAAQRLKQDEADRKNAEEAAGVLVPNSETYQGGEKFGLFKVRQADGTYTNERRSLGKAEAPPQNPQAPMSAERFAQELQLERQKAALNNSVPPLDFLTETSSTGVPYIDASKVESKTLNALQTAAGQAGKKVVDKDTAQGLRDIKTAKDNQQSMMDMLNGKLAESPVSRLFVAPANRAKQIGQIDPNLAATGTFLGPAIASLRAVAGAKSFRITKAEIDAAIQNFVPLATDTVDTAKAKMAALGHFMDNKEKAALGGAPGSAAPSNTNARVLKFDANGNPMQ